MMEKYGWNRFSVISQNHVDKIWMLTRDAIEEIGTQKNMTVAAVYTYGSEPDFSLPDIVAKVAKVSRSEFII